MSEALCWIVQPMKDKSATNHSQLGVVKLVIEQQKRDRKHRNRYHENLKKKK